MIGAIVSLILALGVLWVCRQDDKCEHNWFPVPLTPGVYRCAECGETREGHHLAG